MSWSQNWLSLVIPFMATITLSLLAIFAVSTHVNSYESSEIRTLIAPAATQVDKQLAIFYNMFFPHNKSSWHTWTIVAEQLEQISGSYVASKKKITLYYNIVGRGVNSTWMPWLCEHYGVDCRFLQHYEAGHEDVTLTNLHEYCIQNPSKSVIYMHPKGSFHNRRTQNYWRRHMTMAVGHEKCLQALEENSCDSCGLMFDVIPTEHFHGNIWMAKCSYIRKLHSPAVTREKRQDTLRQLERENATIQFSLCPRKTWNLGMDRFLWEHWLGSHPSLRPCDLSPSSEDRYWKTHTRNLSDFVFAQAPRHRIKNSHMPSCPIKDDSVWTNRTWRLQEYFLLPGKLFRWVNEYNEVPAEDSWIWKWHPDGEKFQKAIGNKSTNILDVIKKEQELAATYTSSKHSL